jgi:hypothetical protein
MNQPKSLALICKEQPQKASQISRKPIKDRNHPLEVGGVPSIKDLAPLHMNYAVTLNKNVFDVQS